MSDSGYTMYGAEFSLYSGKLRSYLYKKGIAFREIRPWALTYKRFIVPRTGVSYIPVLQTPEDEVWQDTSVIIDHLEARFPDPAMIPSSPRQKLAALILELFGDEWLLISAMHYRWNATAEDMDELYVDFGRMVLPWGPRALHKRMGKKLGSRFRNFLPRLGITDATIPAIEAWYEALVADLEKHFSAHDYLLGERPSIADFGFIGPFYAHLYRDPRPGPWLRAEAPKVSAWIERMMSNEPSKLVSAAAADDIPETLLPILRRFASEQLPVLQDTAMVLDAWALEEGRAQAKHVRVPRGLGTHDVKIAGVPCERSVIPYSLWMFQRVLDGWSALEGQKRAHGAEFLEQIGLKLDDWQQQTRLVRFENKLRIEQH